MQKNEIMQQLVGTRNEDMRYDFLLFIGMVASRCLPDLYHAWLRYMQPRSATVSYAYILDFCKPCGAELNRWLPGVPRSTSIYAITQVFLQE